MKQTPWATNDDIDLTFLGYYRPYSAHQTSMSNQVGHECKFCHHAKLEYLPKPSQRRLSYRRTISAYYHLHKD